MTPPIPRGGKDRTMRKKITEILLTFAILAVLSAAFWKVGWLTTAREVGALFAIAAAVIAVDLAGAFVRKKIQGRR